MWERSPKTPHVGACPPNTPCGSVPHKHPVWERSPQHQVLALGQGNGLESVSNK
ncbi:hypothetical protein DPMN_019489 [Dreissena polymorpha]|uniref:Uncharacterized protein n=1 Tax=Dreissena polymorpha TaxID=45954 RepID=A0A9D4NF48_DREPO|nr:hypothetical protein DPMN_019489 [Dreissena polymorpha]